MFSEIVNRYRKYKKMTIKDYVSPYAAVSEVQEKWKLVPAFLESRGLVKQHLDSFNYLLTQGLQKIIKANARTDVDQNFFWNYDNIYVDPPDVEYGMRSEAITPHECRLRLEFASFLVGETEMVQFVELLKTET